MTKCTPNQLSKLPNTYCLLYSLIQIHLAKYLTHIVCLNHCTMTKCTPNQLTKLADT